MGQSQKNDSNDNNNDLVCLLVETVEKKMRFIFVVFSGKFHQLLEDGLLFNFNSVCILLEVSSNAAPYV